MSLGDNGSTCFTPRFVIVARHGERLDYIRRDAGDPWTPTAEKPYDPPLTDHGTAQALRLGQYLATELPRLGVPPVRHVYTSPFLRCRQTSLAAAQGLQQSLSSPSETEADIVVRVEYGLCESFNDPWYRSWAIPGTDGTWGFRSKDLQVEDLDPETIHPWSKQPIQDLPLFQDWRTDPGLDVTYESQTVIPKPYALHPVLNLENREEQCARMKDVVDKTIASSSEGDTILLFSHGAPVTHLIEELTGKSWKEHGRSVYCCYSIYQSTPDGGWKAIAVNESKYLHEELQGDNYVAEETK